MVEPLLTSMEVARKLKVSHKTVDGWACEGYLPGIALGTGRRKQWRFRESDIDHWLVEQQKLSKGQQLSKNISGATDSGTADPDLGVLGSLKT